MGGSVPDEFGVGIAGELGMSQRPGPLSGSGWDWFGDVGWELPVELGAGFARVVVTRLGGPAALLTLIFIERFLRAGVLYRGFLALFDGHGAEG